MCIDPASRRREINTAEYAAARELRLRRIQSVVVGDSRAIADAATYEGAPGPGVPPSNAPELAPVAEAAAGAARHDPQTRPHSAVAVAAVAFVAGVVLGVLVQRRRETRKFV
jgi:hypothetical protein